MEASTVASLIDEARTLFQTVGACHRIAPREASWLVARALRRSEAWALSHGEEVVPKANAQRIRALARRRSRGEPFAYLFEEREFYGRTFHVDSRVLVPRPETELLVELALELDLPEHALVVDVGTGSGCLAISLALERPKWRVLASDLSLAALLVAETNKRTLAPHTEVGLICQDALLALEATPELIVCNPPYVDPNDPSTIDEAVARFEPKLALFLPDGESLYQRLLRGPREGPSRRLLFELGQGMLGEFEGWCQDVGARIELVRHDLQGIPRAVCVLTGTNLAES